MKMKWMRRLCEAGLWLAAGVAMWRYARDLRAVWRIALPLHDFGAYLAAAQRLVDGESIYAAPDFRYRYPPTLALLLAPLTLFPPLTAQRLWTLIDQGFLAAGVGLSLRLLPRRPSRVETALLLAIGFGFFPIYTQVKLGQLGNLLFLLTALTATAWQRGDRVRAGWPVALAGALKVYPLGFTLWFVRQGAWRTAIVVGVVCAAILILPELIFRGGWLEDYVRALPVMFSAGASPIKADNQSFFAFVARLDGSVGDSARWLSVDFAVATAFAFTALILTLACSPARTMRGDELAITLTATALPLAWANPVGWSHGYVVLLLAAPALVQRLAGRLRDARRPADFAAAAAALAAWVCLSQPYRLPRVLGHGEVETDPTAMLLRSTFLFGTIVLWIVLLREMRLGRREVRPLRESGGSRR
jgi:hypothetical protein